MQHMLDLQLITYLIFIVVGVISQMYLRKMLELLFKKILIYFLLRFYSSI